jgi:hypothetical protein
LIWRVVWVGRLLLGVLACCGRRRFILHEQLRPALTAKTRRTV